MHFSVPLPERELSLFKKATDCYKRQQFKNGLKFANQILSTSGFQNHPEALGIKGLLMYFIGKRELGYEIVRQGIQANVKSAMCWHCYGSLYRHDRSYEEAIKCMTNALRWQAQDFQILDELSILQIQMRDFEGFVETRRKILQIEPQQRASWACLAVGYHLLDEYDSCREILENLRKLINRSSRNCSKRAYSEFLLYENSVIEESGDTSGALMHLTENQEHIMDKVALLEVMFRLHDRMRNFVEAESCLQQLLSKNPENSVYYKLLFVILQVETDKNKYIVLKDILTRFPEAKLPRLWMLRYAQGEDFVREIDIYLQRGLRRDVPALFVEIKPLYAKDRDKASFIEGLMHNYLECLKKHGTLKKEMRKKKKKKRDPSTIELWVYYYLAQHYRFLNKFDKAFEYIDLAISHSPNVPELYIVKGKIYKKAGNPQLAADYLFQALLLDPKDKCLNSKCVKYLLQADRIEQAQEVASRFVFDPDIVDEQLFTAQCFWYLVESALAYERLGMFEEALKKCYEVHYHLDNFYDDQFEYHEYAFKELMLKSYVNFLRREENVKKHYLFKESYHCSLRINLKYYDSLRNAYGIGGLPNVATDYDPCISSSVSNCTTVRKMTSKKRRTRVEELKPYYEKKCNVLNDYPLDEATRILNVLELIAEDDVETHILAYELYSRKNKILLMLKSIKRGYEIDPDNGVMHQIIVIFTLYVNNIRALNLYNEKIFQVIDKRMEVIWAGRSPKAINDDFIRRNENKLEALFNASYAMYRIDQSKKRSALKLCTSLEDSLVDLSVCLCKKILEAMRNGMFGACDNEIHNYIIKCREKFPLATVFK